jgi:hypothetical protein
MTFRIHARLGKHSSGVDFKPRLKISREARRESMIDAIDVRIPNIENFESMTFGQHRTA